MDMEDNSQKKMIVYAHNYCGQALMLARVLKKNAVDHEWRDVMTGPPEWQEELKALANGNLSVPTVVFPDGGVLVEPWPEQVLKAAGIEKSSVLGKLRDRLMGE